MPASRTLGLTAESPEGARESGKGLRRGGSHEPVNELQSFFGVNASRNCQNSNLGTEATELGLGSQKLKCFRLGRKRCREELDRCVLQHRP